MEGSFGRLDQRAVLEDPESCSRPVDSKGGTASRLSVWGGAGPASGAEPVCGSNVFNWPRTSAGALQAAGRFVRPAATRGCAAPARSESTRSAATRTDSDAERCTSVGLASSGINIVVAAGFQGAYHELDAQGVIHSF